MKVALCLSGQPRYLDLGYSEIAKNLLSYQPDIFIHTWWDESMVGKEMILSPHLTYGRKYQWEENTHTKIMELYNPINIVTEPQREFNIYPDVDYEKVFPISPYSMFYSIKRANDLKSNYESKKGFKYDLVIRCRFDIKFDFFNLDLEKIDPNTFYLNSVADTFPNDQFAISGSDSMDYYSSLFNYLDGYYSSGFRNFVGERLLKHHLRHQRVDFTNSFKNDIIKNG